MVRSIRRYTVAGLLALMLALVGLSAAATSMDDVKNEISDATRKEQEAKARAEQLEAAGVQMKNKLASLQEQLLAIEANMEQLELSGEEISFALAGLEEQIAAGEADVEKRKADMALRIRYMYEQDAAALWETFFSAGSLSDVLNSAEYISSITEYDQKMMDVYEQSLAELGAMREAALAQQALLDENTRALMAEQEKVQKLRDETIREIDAYAARIRAAQEEADSYAALAADRRELLARLEKEAEEERRRQEEEKRRQEEQKKNPPVTVTPGSGSTLIDPSEVNESGYTNLQLLAAIVECEAGGESYEGKIAVGNVIFNRIASSRFPGTLYGVIYQKGAFSPVASGRLELVLSRGANDKCREAASDIIGGARVIDESYLFFRRNREGLGIDGLIIGNHIFY